MYMSKIGVNKWCRRCKENKGLLNKVHFVFSMIFDVFCDGIDSGITMRTCGLGECFVGLTRKHHHDQSWHYA